MGELRLEQSDVLTLIASLMHSELEERPHAGRIDLSTPDPGLSLADGGLELDSLDRLRVASRISQFFHVHETGLEDLLLAARTAGDLARIVEQARVQAHAHLTFQTGGSTGDPKPCTHAVTTLNQEVAALAPLFRGVSRIVALVPPHHIYGFLFTVMLPRALSVPVLRVPVGKRSAPALAAGDLVVAVPAIWDYLHRSGRTIPTGVTGVSSTAPMPPALGMALRDRLRLVEVYGSSETGGIGWRDGDGPFRLFEHWRKSPDSESVLVRSRPDRTEALASAPDNLVWHGERAVVPAGRVDAAVQVGGHNVFLSRVERVLRDHPFVADCAVRLDGEGAMARLKAFVVFIELVPPSEGVPAMEAWARVHLKPHERPVRFDSGPALPRTEMGKLSDW